MFGKVAKILFVAFWVLMGLAVPLHNMARKQYHQKEERLQEYRQKHNSVLSLTLSSPQERRGVGEVLEVSSSLSGSRESQDADGVYVRARWNCDYKRVQRIGINIRLTTTIKGLCPPEIPSFDETLGRKEFQLGDEKYQKPLEEIPSFDETLGRKRFQLGDEKYQKPLEEMTPEEISREFKSYGYDTMITTAPVGGGTYKEK